MAIEQRTTWKPQVSEIRVRPSILLISKTNVEMLGSSVYQMDMTSNLLCSKKDTKGIVRTNCPLNTEDSVEVSQQSFPTCPELGALTLFTKIAGYM